jgi:stage II sporulation protein D
MPRLIDTALTRVVLRWLRRTGPAGSLFVALFAVQLLFFGCIQFSESARWGRGAGPETAPDTRVDRQIRVRLQGRAAKPSAELSVTAPFSIANAQTGALLLPENAPLESAAVRPSGREALQVGAKTIPCGDILITPIRDASIVLNGQTYRGRLRIHRVEDGLAFVNQLDIESYVRGVLRGELPGSFHSEAFKAQCVAARTYALYQRDESPRERIFDVYDDEGSQMYVGVRGEDRVSNDAVEATAGEVCTYSDGKGQKIFCTYYSSACGGLSQWVRNVKPNDPDVPPLAGNVRCNDCSGAKYYRWQPVRFAKSDVTKRLVGRYPSLKKLGVITDLNTKASTTDGRVVRIELVGSGGARETLAGEDFRLAVGARQLKSTNFKIENQKGYFVFKDGKGFGHGMGLCQHGMETKARRGMNYKQILQTYYPGAQIKKIY